MSLCYFHYLLLKDFCSELILFLLLVFNPTEKRVDSDLTVELRELRVLVKNDSSTKDGDLRALEARLNTTEQQLEKLQSEVQRLGKENQGDVWPQAGIAW